MKTTLIALMAVSLTMMTGNAFAMDAEGGNKNSIINSVDTFEYDAAPILLENINIHTIMATSGENGMYAYSLAPTQSAGMMKQKNTGKFKKFLEALSKRSRTHKFAPDTHGRYRRDR